MTHDHLIVIGGSWGGMRAVATILAALPTDFRTPIVIAQHRAVDSTGESMTNFLASRSMLPVTEVEDKEIVEGGRVYLAPADYHLLVEPGSLALSTDERVQFSRPSVDVLFESAADSYATKAVGVLLTGSNEDGARGLMRLKRAGALTIVQEPSTAERPEMPQAAIKTGAATLVLPLDDIAPHLVGVEEDERRKDGRIA